MKVKIIFILAILLNSIQLLAQTKAEREKRVRFEDFPKQAQTLLNSIPEKHKRMKYYFETDGKKSSYEAKFKYGKKYYSLEFDIFGIVEDIEVIIDELEIPKEVISKISDYFMGNFDNYKLVKVQKQYVKTSEKSTTDFIVSVLNGDSIDQISYEIIAQVKSGRKRHYLEVVFESEGNFISSRMVGLDEYGHVLY